DAEYDGLVMWATADSARLVAADVGFIHFNVALHEFKAISLRHQQPNLLAHAPRGFVGDAKRALHLLAAHAVARRDEQVDRIEPNRQRRAAVLKDRASARVHMIAA